VTAPDPQGAEKYEVLYQHFSDAYPRLKSWF
jgi:hypothetical protein